MHTFNWQDTVLASRADPEPSGDVHISIRIAGFTYIDQPIRLSLKPGLHIICTECV